MLVAIVIVCEHFPRNQRCGLLLLFILLCVLLLCCLIVSRLNVTNDLMLSGIDIHICGAFMCRQKCVCVCNLYVYVCVWLLVARIRSLFDFRIFMKISNSLFCFCFFFLSILSGKNSCWTMAWMVFPSPGGGMCEYNVLCGYCETEMDMIAVMIAFL